MNTYIKILGKIQSSYSTLNKSWIEYLKKNYKLVLNKDLSSMSEVDIMKNINSTHVESLIRNDLTFFGTDKIIRAKGNRKSLFFIKDIHVKLDKFIKKSFKYPIEKIVNSLKNLSKSLRKDKSKYFKFTLNDEIYYVNGSIIPTIKYEVPWTLVGGTHYEQFFIRANYVLDKNGIKLSNPFRYPCEDKKIHNITKISKSEYLSIYSNLEEKNYQPIIEKIENQINTFESHKYVDWRDIEEDTFVSGDNLYNLSIDLIKSPEDIYFNCRYDNKVILSRRFSETSSSSWEYKLLELINNLVLDKVKEVKEEKVSKGFKYLFANIVSSSTQYSSLVVVYNYETGNIKVFPFRKFLSSVGEDITKLEFYKRRDLLDNYEFGGNYHDYESSMVIDDPHNKLIKRALNLIPYCLKKKKFKENGKDEVDLFNEFLKRRFSIFPKEIKSTYLVIETNHLMFDSNGEDEFYSAVPPDNTFLLARFDRREDNNWLPDGKTLTCEILKSYTINPSLNTTYYYNDRKAVSLEIDKSDWLEETLELYNSRPYLCFMDIRYISSLTLEVLCDINDPEEREFIKSFTENKEYIKNNWLGIIKLY